MDFFSSLPSVEILNIEAERVFATSGEEDYGYALPGYVEEEW